jgi:predicted HAD superfamily phosphohydrolase YqeG
MRISIIFTFFFAFLIIATHNTPSLAHTPPINSIQETSDLKNILDYVDKDTIVFLDLDNTLIAANQTLGTDQWYIDRINFFKQQGYNDLAAINKAINQWRKVQKLTTVKPMQSNTAELINQLQKKSYYFAEVINEYQ